MALQDYDQFAAKLHKVTADISKAATIRSKPDGNLKPSIDFNYLLKTI